MVYFEEYPTYYPCENRHEQKPQEWLSAVKKSISRLVENTSDDIRNSIAGLGLSGHSLGMVPLNERGDLLLESVPIWSDSRPGKAELEPFFAQVSEESWYMKTGNGFPPGLYTVFKILWMKHNQPDVFQETRKVIGTKDYINFMLTGKIVTDYSYASGSGVYDLKAWNYSDELLEASGLDKGLFPDILASTDVCGTIKPAISEELGLPKTVRVVAGGVDNSCMALGAKCYVPGRVYNSLGSSSWIAVSSSEPVLDQQTRPYVFTHVVPGQFASATAIFSAGSSFKWLGKVLYDGNDPDYSALDNAAESVTPGCENLIFNPSLAGGSKLDKSPYVRGAFLGLSLNHSRAHIVRSVMEGVGFGLRIALDSLRALTDISEEMTIVGGGSKSQVWRKILADIFNIRIVKTSIDQQAAALGAASLALYGCGIWSDFTRIDELHQIESVSVPQKETVGKYDKLLEMYKDISNYLSDLGNKMHRD